MTFTLTPDNRYVGAYDLKDGKELLAYVFKDPQGSIEIGWVKNKFTVTRILTILDFLNTYDKWLTEDQW